MVRLLKVKKLEDRKHFLLARSEMYRQTLTLEIANVKFSAALHRRTLKARLARLLLLGSVFPLAGFFFARKRPKPAAVTAGGFLSKLLAGLKLAGKCAPWLKTIRAAKGHAGERENITHFP
ncbi:MAG: hypothetical protein JWQ04_2225 [Pedosphaera sp.]|nr:hypothetical protein [Pedosphaera sp.]